jgi:histidine triad (HIT) family protein
MAQDPECLFCRIVAEELPADVVHRDERVVAFRDIDPQSPVHVLVVPVEHHADVGALAAADGGLLADLVRVGSAIAEDECAGEYRLVFNTGRAAHQSVFHVHGHVLGGRSLGWPPG